MRYLVYGILMTGAFLAGWQVENHKRIARLSDLTPFAWCVKELQSDAHPQSGYVDILVRDDGGAWRTLAFAAIVESGYARVQRHDELLVAKVTDKVLFRPTLHPGETFVCDECRIRVRHELQVATSQTEWLTHRARYECPICRLRILPIIASDHWNLVHNFRNEERYFPKPPKVVQQEMSRFDE